MIALSRFANPALFGLVTLLVSLADPVTASLPENARDTFVPLAYVELQPAAASARNIQAITELLGRHETLIQSMTIVPVLNNLTKSLNEAEGLDRNAPFRLGLHINPSLPAAVARDEPSGQILERNLHFSIAIPVTSPEVALRTLFPEATGEGDIRHLNTGVQILLDRAANRLLVHNGDKPLDPEKTGSSIAALWPANLPEGAIRFRLNWSVVEGIFSTDLAPFLKPQTNERETSAMAMKAWAWELYSRYYLHLWQMSPAVPAGAIRLLTSDDSLILEYDLVTDGGSRTFYRLYRPARIQNVRAQKAKGQHPLRFTAPLAYVSIPLAGRDLLEAMEGYRAQDQFLARDVVNGMVALLDILALEDSREGLLRQIQRNADLYILDIPSKGGALSAFSIVVALEVDDPRWFVKLLTKHAARQKALAGKLQIKNIAPDHWLITHGIGNIHIRLADGVIFFSSGDMAEKALIRAIAAGRQPGARVDQWEKRGTDYPTVCILDLDALSGYDSMREILGAVPNLRSLEWRSWQEEGGNEKGSFVLYFQTPKE